MNNRKLHFQLIFLNKGITESQVASFLKMSKINFRKKLLGSVGFKESEIKKILKLLNMKFEEVFI